jgi:hypothetical protein
MSERNERSWQGLPWSKATKGEKVWLRGTSNGRFYAYGPHTVHEPAKKQLSTATPAFKGAVFMHYAEDLLVPAN